MSLPKPYYQDDYCTIYNADCINILKSMPDKSVDFVLCDLPYGITNCKWDNVIPFDLMWEQYNRLIKNRGCIALFCAEPFASKLRMSNIKQYKYDWIWDKCTLSNPLIAKYQPLRRYENIAIFSKMRHNYYPIFTTINNPRKNHKPTKKKTDLFSGLASGYFERSEKNKKHNQRYPYNIIKLNRQSTECSNDKRLHPTQKPVALCEYLINTYTKIGETVLDNCMGVGSTLVASKNLNRKAIGIEIEERYCEIAVERLQNVQMVK